MHGTLRGIIGIGLVLLILSIVVSPYADLPLTTLQAKQLALALRLAGSLIVCWATLAGGREVYLCAARHFGQELKVHSQADRDLLGLTCALLC